jgi:hypothetical protein
MAGKVHRPYKAARNSQAPVHPETVKQRGLSALKRFIAAGLSFEGEPLITELLIRNTPPDEAVDEDGAQGAKRGSETS